MHAIRLHAFGPAENLTYETTDDPLPGPGQVRIAVRAAGVHLLDTALREGHQGPAPKPTALPTIPGREVAGTVESLGDGVAGLWLGKRVVAHLGFAPGGTPNWPSPTSTASTRSPGTSTSPRPSPWSARGVRRWGSSSSPSSARTPWS